MKIGSSECKPVKFPILISSSVSDARCCQYLRALVVSSRITAARSSVAGEWSSSEREERRRVVELIFLVVATAADIVSRRADSQAASFPILRAVSKHITLVDELSHTRTRTHRILPFHGLSRGLFKVWAISSYLKMAKNMWVYVWVYAQLTMPTERLDRY